MIFQDRIHAGLSLAKALSSLNSQKDTLVIGIPRGGVIVAKEVADALHLPLDIICPRKIGAPYNPEFAIGAVTESGEAYIDPDLVRRLGIDKEYLDEKIAEESKRAAERLRLFREGMSPRDILNKTVILVDDGLATGATVKAAIVSLKKEGASRIVVAVPVSPPDTASEIKALADELIALHVDPGFMAVGQYYRNFSETTNSDVLQIMQKL
ncbi:phosphoribosyltransferase [Estrella lausannensis]|uniref:Putative phosphoribosyltransferase n=1 Tax=Estrella lausannensis TaxID=483423 RepID=A0A0H5E4R5_9BACT|nr:phosphoribosyltransferase family protein [Estrella lausannensis]CRX38235.1 Putative phosphoribosyltransferase [Estrella lausannensis]